MPLQNFSKLELVAAALGLIVLYVYLRKLGRSPLPPGPKGFPIVGNVTDMPSKRAWVTFAEWGRKWGGICSVKLLGRSIIIINSFEIMNTLGKEGAKYSDRPRMEMAELVGYGETFGFLSYGPRFRTFRKYFANYVGPIPMERHMDTVEHETYRFLKRQLAHPEALMPNLRKLAGGVILQLTYGITVEEGEDPFVNLIERSNQNLNAATAPGAFFVDFFPSIRHLPEWLPGMGFMETARTWAKVTAAMIDIPYAYTEQKIASGAAPPSFVANMLEKEGNFSEEQIRDIKLVASSMYAGGADTTVSAEYAFFLAMVLYPDVLKKAQEEIDIVIGNDRLPTHTDCAQLPYISAVVSEVLRWNSVAPIAIPHTAREDGIINGYVIPKGSIIITNLWNMLHDPEIYPDPFVFNPDRHIATGNKCAQEDPRSICFGYGRRICPGMYLAEASLFATISTSIAVFSISKAVENGVEITPVHENTSGIISYPKAFNCTIRARSEKAVALIAQEYHL